MFRDIINDFLSSPQNQTFDGFSLISNLFWIYLILEFKQAVFLTTFGLSCCNDQLPVP